MEAKWESQKGEVGYQWSNPEFVMPYADLHSTNPFRDGLQQKLVTSHTSSREKHITIPLMPVWDMPFPDTGFFCLEAWVDRVPSIK